MFQALALAWQLPQDACNLQSVGICSLLLTNEGMLVRLASHWSLLLIAGLFGMCRFFPYLGPRKAFLGLRLLLEPGTWSKLSSFLCFPRHCSVCRSDHFMHHLGLQTLAHRIPFNSSTWHDV